MQMIYFCCRHQPVTCGECKAGGTKVSTKSEAVVNGGLLSLLGVTA